MDSTRNLSGINRSVVKRRSSGGQTVVKHGGQIPRSNGGISPAPDPPGRVFDQRLTSFWTGPCRRTAVVWTAPASQTQLMDEHS